MARLPEERRDLSEYPKDTLEPHENQIVRRTVDDVDDIVADRRDRQRDRARIKQALLWILGLPAALVGTGQAVVTLLNYVAKFWGKTP